MVALALAGCFLGRPRPGPGRRVIGFKVGSDFRGPSTAAVVVPFEAGGGSFLFWALRRPWKCWLDVRVSEGNESSSR